MGDYRYTRRGGIEQGTYPTLEDAVANAERNVPAEEGVVFWSPATYASDGTRLHGVRAVRSPEDGVVPFKDTTGISDWWDGLPEDVKGAVAGDPGRELEGNVLYHVQVPRPQATGAYWVATGEEPRFHLHRAAQIYVRAVRTWR